MKGHILMRILKSLGCYLILLLMPSTTTWFATYILINDIVAAILSSSVLVFLILISVQGSKLAIQLLGGRRPRKDFFDVEERLKNLSQKANVMPPKLYISHFQKIPIYIFRRFIGSPEISVSSWFSRMLSTQEQELVVSCELLKSKNDFYPLKNILLIYHLMEKQLRKTLLKQTGMYGKDSGRILDSMINIFFLPIRLFMDFSHNSLIWHDDNVIELNENSLDSCFYFSAKSKFDQLEELSTTEVFFLPLGAREKSDYFSKSVME